MPNSSINSYRKILVLTENFPPISGGSGRWFWELYSRIPRNEVIVVANKDLTLNTEDFDALSQMDILRIPLASPEWGFRSIVGLKFYLRSIIALRKIVKEHNVTEIHCGRVIHEGVIAWLLSLIANIKFCCYVHGEDVETAAISREHNMMVTQVGRKADYFICNSHNSANIVKRLHYAPNEKIHVLQPGVNSQRFVPASPNSDFKAKMGWTNKFVILTVGRLQKRKGHAQMIKAMPHILNKHADVLYVIVGSGECEVELVEQTANLNLQTQVQMKNGLSDDDMISCYQQCDLFILPNITIENDIEGFGMVIVEAQACGKPVVAGDSGGTKETMIEGRTGKIIDCNDPRILADFLCDLLDARDSLSEMGNCGRDHVVAHLDWVAHVEKAEVIFKSN